MMAQLEQRLVPERVIGGKYRIIRLLGEGGMGGVYEAENELTHKRVAIKWLHPSLAGSRDAVQRLLREAQACARVRHPHVVDVYDVGQENDSVFLVMEYLEGETFRAALQRRELPLEALIGLLIPAMRGVAAVHAKGIVHRDIKPDNIFLARVPDYPTPVPKVLDFGISKVDARQGEMETLTQSGVSMGTPLYMSFEQLTGAKDADARSDIYAFGVMLYEAATGRAPFEADTFGALAVKVATTEPTPPSAFHPGLDRALEAIILKAMARDRSQRFDTLDALIAELERFASHAERRHPSTRPRAITREDTGPAAFAATMAQPTPRTEPSPVPRSTRRALAAIVLVLMVGGAALAYLREPAKSHVADVPAGPEASDATVTQPAAGRLTNDRTTPANSASGPAKLTEPAPPPTAASPTSVAPAPEQTGGGTATSPKPAVGLDARKPRVAGGPRKARASAPAKTPSPVISGGTPAPSPGSTADSANAPPQPTPTSNPDRGFRAGQPRLDEF